MCSASGMRILIALLYASALTFAEYEVPVTKLSAKMPSRASIRSASYTDSKDALRTPDTSPRISLSVGLPKQYCVFAMDTTHGDTFIVDINDEEQPHDAYWEYNSKSSSTLKVSSYPYRADVLDINGYKASIQGKIADDVFILIMGDQGNNIAVNESFPVKFALIQSVIQSDPSQDLWIPDHFTTGRLGLGFTGSENMDLFASLMLKPFPLAQRKFMLGMIECMPDDNDESDYSVFVVGGYLKEDCNSSTLVNVQLALNNRWDFFIDNFYIGDFHENYRQLVAINTIEMLTGVPQSVYDTVVKMTNATYNPKYKWPIVDCDLTYPDMHFSIAGQNITVSENLYIFRDFKSLQKINPCHLMLYPMNGGGFLPSWSFGYLWLYRKCMVFDYGNRGMAFMDYNKNIC